MDCKGDPTKPEYLTFDQGGMSTINWRTLYKESHSNKASRDKTNKIRKEILEIPQETCPYIFPVKAASVCQPVYQFPSQLNSKEGTQLKCQRNCQVPSQGSNQLICQIDPIRYPIGFPRDMTSIIPVSSGFVDSNFDTIGSTSDKPTKDPSPMPIINPSILTSETPTNDPSHVPKELKSDKPRNMLMEYSSGDPTCAPSTMPYDKPSSKPSAQPRSDQDVLKQGSQEAQVSLQKYLTLFILHIILYLSSRQRAIRTLR